MNGRIPALVIIVIIAGLMGCAATSPPPLVVPTGPLGEVIAGHNRLAQQYEQDGDLAAAETEWHILSLIAPADKAIRGKWTSLRNEIKKRSLALFDKGMTALQAGDYDAAQSTMLRVLALEPQNGEAVAVLRRLDEQRLRKIQAEHQAHFYAVPNVPPPARSAPRAEETRKIYDLDQGLEMLRMGDIDKGMSEVRGYLRDHADDAVARRRLNLTAQQRAGLLESQGDAERALALYERAAELGGEMLPSWPERIRTLRKQLAGEYYEKGLRVYSKDLTRAIRYFETSLRYDPGNLKASLRLNEARRMQLKLRQLPKTK